MTTTTNSFDAILAGYAGGTLPEPARVLVSSHLELSGRNRGYVRDLEMLAGLELEAIAPVPLKGRDEKLARIFALGEALEPRPASRPRAPLSGSRLPRPLAEFLGRDVDAIHWRTLLPGVREFKVGKRDGCESTMYWIRGGKPIPSHTHEGMELTLVLEGAFSDTSGRYGPGDVCLADDEVDHKPIAEAGVDCLCFAVTDAPLRLTGPIGRLLAPFLR
ncbi:ChrR family anti-sigma-E factor [Prosthecomicrobium sp. N25]|uniref:ChrR family anti-sigma-E factor n=1 Tax=Prosthecomicrobium sp. N25 TaxID=3129254 RepID=UPI003078934D